MEAIDKHSSTLYTNCSRELIQNLVQVKTVVNDILKDIPYSPKLHTVFKSQSSLINRFVNRVRTFQVCVPTHVALRIFVMQVLASQLLFLGNRNAGQAIPPLFWPVNCVKIGGHVALLSDPTVNCLYCGSN